MRGSFAVLLVLCGLCLACNGESRRPEAKTERESALPEDPSPVAAPAPPVVAEPSRDLELPEPKKAKAAKLEVLVSERPSEVAEKKVLAGYERLGMSRNGERLSVHTDRNGAEFPHSLTSAHLGGTAVAQGVGAGPARALKVDLHLETQGTRFAGCDCKKRNCGCEKIIPYSYISISHELPAKVFLGQFESLSFWSRSAEPFELQVVLSCFVRARPDAGYLDAAHTELDPCWHNTRVELKLPDPIEIRGDDKWHRYEVRMADLPAPEPVLQYDRGLVACTFDDVTQIAYVLKKSHPAVLGEYPRDQGTIYFDDLEGLGKR